MAMALTHFAVGAAFTSVFLALFVPRCRYRGTIVVLGGVWGLVPDFHHITPVWRHKLRMFHRHSPVLDLFWFHQVLDVHEIANTRTFGAIALLGFLCSTVLLERRAKRK